jgi:hypothetical protein
MPFGTINQPTNFMSKKNLTSAFLILLLITGNLRSATFNIEISVGGADSLFPEASKGLLIVDTAGDGFDFTSNSTLLLNGSESTVGSKFGNDDTVVLANLQTVPFPEIGRGFNVAVTELNTGSFNENLKSGDKVALVWFPEGNSTAGKAYYYYTSNITNNGTIAFVTPEDGSTDSIVAVGIRPTQSGKILATPTPTQGGPGPSGAPSSGGGGGPSVQKSKKSKKGGSGSAKKSSDSSKKSAGKKSSGGSAKKSGAKKAKKK